MQKNTMVIDISHWNEVHDWGSIRSDGVIGVIHKFSQGTGYRDDRYEQARTGCKMAGLLFGRYHFAEGSNVEEQVDNFLAGVAEGELLALDWEDNTGSAGTMTLDQAEEFVTLVEKRTGRVPVLYSGNTAKEAIKTPNPTLVRCRLWLAHYSDAPVCPPGWQEPWLWQWSDTGSVAGVVGNVDTDAYDGSVLQLLQEWTGGDRSDPEVPAADGGATVVAGAAVVIPIEPGRG